MRTFGRGLASPFALRKQRHTREQKAMVVLIRTQTALMLRTDAVERAPTNCPKQ